MGSEKKDVLDTIDSSNIFDEFETNALKHEFGDTKGDGNGAKDKYDHFSTAAKVLSVFFWLGLIVMGVFYGYIKIQNNDEFKDATYLGPICNLFVGTYEMNNEKCSSISTIEKELISNQKIEKDKLATKIHGIISQLIKYEDFNSSKNVQFLLETTQNKLQLLDLLHEFEVLQFEFNKKDRNQIKCKNFEINEFGELSAQCEAYSSPYARDIKGFTGEDSQKVSGTSISVASSFLNYIEKKSESFQLLEKQKIFKSEPIISDYSNYTNKTTFELQLQYTQNITKL
ncbi:MAG: hypothetical protein GY828_07340 [Candidatus Gracilibacteria bacterium]|nr:hypothetical protein [Candidatus Gracilibacteria bacterium]